VNYDSLGRVRLGERIGFAVGSEAVDVAVVIVTFRSEDRIDRLLTSLRSEVGNLCIAVTVVDNASNDRTCEVVQLHEDVKLIAHGENSGYAHGVNLGMAASPSSEIVLILNPDMRVEPSMVSELHAALKRFPDLGIAVPLLRDEDGQISPSIRNEPRVSAVLGDSLLGGRWKTRPLQFGEIVYDPRRYNVRGSIDWATGAAFAISRECVEAIGWWDDETFFLYSEETDYCRRARDAGWDIQIVPSAVAQHAGGGSGSSPILDGLLALSRVRYVRKHCGLLSASATWLFQVFGQVLRVRRPGGFRRLSVLARPWAYWNVVHRRLHGSRPSPV
jgi:GT2 family glycosyltransferase